MKKKLRKFSLFFALLSMPLFFSLNSKVRGVLAEDICGKVKISSVEKTFGSSSTTNLVSTMASIMKNNFSSNDSMLDVTVELYKDIETMEFAPKKASGKDLELKTLNLKLNGHSMKVKGSREYNLTAINIEGGGGRMDFCSWPDKIYNWDHSIFHFDNHQGGSIFSIKDTTFINVCADHLFYLDECADGIERLDMENCYFENMQFEQEGGILSFYDDYIKEINVKNCTFSNIQCWDYGGCFYIDGSRLTNINMSGNIFDNIKIEESGYYGGIIYLNDDGVYIGNDSKANTDKNIVMNCASWRGGAIFSNGEEAKIQNFVFYNNEAYDYGGALYINQDEDRILNCMFINNTSGYGGGAIYLNDSNETIIDSTFKGNVSDNNKGHELYNNSSELTLTSNKFYGVNSNSFYKCSPSSDQSNSSGIIKFLDSRNYSGNNLIRGNNRDNPIYITGTQDFYAFVSNCAADSNYKNKHYLLTSSGFGAPEMPSGFKGSLNYGGHWIKWANEIPNHSGYTTFNVCDIHRGDMTIQKDGMSRLSINGSVGYYKPLCSLNPTDDFKGLKSNNYYIFENLTFDTRLPITGSVVIAVKENVILNANNGIRVPKGTSLTMIGMSTNNRPTLNATSTEYSGAAIGGDCGSALADATTVKDSGETMGTVTFENMIVNAKGSHGAGIGGGAGLDGFPYLYASTPGGGGGTLIVTNSDIYATGEAARDIGGGNGGKGAFVPAGGGAGANITLNSGIIEAKTNGIGGGHSGEQGIDGGFDWGLGPTKHGGDGGSLKLVNGKIIANKIGGGTGYLDDKDKPGTNPNGAPTTMTIPDNYVVCIGTKTTDFDEGSRYDVTLDSKISSSYVKIKVAVKYAANMAQKTVVAVYTLNGETYQTTVSAMYTVDKKATCTENEWAHLHATFSDPNVETWDSPSLPIDNTSLGHSYGGEVTYVTKGNTCTATWMCQRSGCTSTQSETVDYVYVKDTDATCTKNEKGHLEARFTIAGFETQATEKNSTEREGTFIKHALVGNPIYHWEGDSCTATAYCSRCKANVSETVTGSFVHEVDENCTENEKGHYHAEFKYGFNSSDSAPLSAEIPGTAYGHNFNGRVEYIWNENMCTAKVMCINKDCDELFVETVEGEFVPDVPATCTENAMGHYVATFNNLPGIFKTQITPYGETEGLGTALGHKFEGKITYYWDKDTNECTASWHCSRCNAVESETVLGDYTMDTPATCTENEKGHCVAHFNNENFNTGQASEKNSVEIQESNLKHLFIGKAAYSFDKQTHEFTATQKCQREGCEDGVYVETCDGVFVPDTPATCLDNAIGHFESNFTTPGFEKQTTEINSYENPGSAIGHSFGGDVTYSWNTETHECTATWYCTHSGCNASQSETVLGVFEEDTPATCLENATGHFKAEFTTNGFKTQYTEPNSFEEPLSALGHEYGGKVTYVWDETTHDCTASWHCIHDGCDEIESETVHGVYVKDTDKTCLENEYGHYEARFNNEGFETQHTPTNSVEVPETAMGHKFGGNIVYSWNNETHECTAFMKCDHPGCNESQIETVAGVYVKDSDATCIDNEKGHYVASFVNPYFKAQSSDQIEIENTALGHDLQITYEWNEDYTQCVAYATCIRGDYTESCDGEISYEYGFAIAKFSNNKFKTQSIKLEIKDRSKTDEEKKEQKIGYIFAGSCGTMTLAIGVGLFFAIRRRIF